ncbi:HAD domain-containing protein, partial [Nocardia salmonicida]|uniref:HAD domain-containing protein n=1 Tax=Nocardia salmonicida TaxID=53431 RepID=UPI0007C816DA
MTDLLCPVWCSESISHSDRDGGITGHSHHPLLFLDVDGPLLPFGEDPGRGPRNAVSDARFSRLSLGAGGRLAELPCQLVWATTWEDEANAEIAPRLGLPRLPVVRWPEPAAEHEREDRWFGLCWKTRTLVDWAAGRPFAWVDDEITDADRSWVAVHHRGPAFLWQVESFRGLTGEDFAALDRWLRSIVLDDTGSNVQHGLPRSSPQTSIDADNHLEMDGTG